MLANFSRFWPILADSRRFQARRKKVDVKSKTYHHAANDLQNAWVLSIFGETLERAFPDSRENPGGTLDARFRHVHLRNEVIVATWSWTCCVTCFVYISSSVNAHQIIIQLNQLTWLNIAHINYLRIAYVHLTPVLRTYYASLTVLWALTHILGILLDVSRC